VLLTQAELMAEHRVYLASAGSVSPRDRGRLAVARSSGLSAPVKWIVPRRARHGVVLPSAATVARNRVWSDPVQVWTEASIKAPTNWIRRAGLGEAFYAAGRHAEAVAAYQEAVRLRTGDSFTYFKLGLCLAELGRFDEASRTFNRLRQQDPASTLVPTGLAHRDDGGEARSGPPAFSARRSRRTLVRSWPGNGRPCWKRSSR
jgi:tetratricopeptide (TPR) repeat protein